MTLTILVIHLDHGLATRETEQGHQVDGGMSDLRESGSIEQDADLILFLYREDAYATKRLDEYGSPDMDDEDNRDPDRGSDAETDYCQTEKRSHGNDKSGFSGSLYAVFEQGL